MDGIQHKIDSLILTKFFEHGGLALDEEANTALIEWHQALISGDSDYLRKKAMEFLMLLSKFSLNALLFPTEDRDKLVQIFDPLEKIFRMAVSVKEKGKVREHFSHTIRNFLFSNYIFNIFDNPNRHDMLKYLAVASIFHDLAYPIEKFKTATQVLADQTFQQYLNSRTKSFFELEDPNNLLDILHHVGQRFIPNGKPKNDDVEKISYVYEFIIAPSIAGQGLFEAPHCLTSVVLFLRPIILDWRSNEPYWKNNIGVIGDICLSMAFHDRNMYPPENVDFQLPEISKALRIADELQEWGRDANNLSYIEDVTLNPRKTDQLLNLSFTLKDRTEGDKDELQCKPYIFVKDKLIGLIPVCDSERIELSMTFPRKIDVTQFEKELINELNRFKFLNKPFGHVENKWEDVVRFDEWKESRKIEINIYQKKAEIKFK